MTDPAPGTSADPPPDARPDAPPDAPPDSGHRTSPPRSLPRRIVRTTLAIMASFVTAVLVVTAGMLVELRMEYTGEPADSARSRGRDALWLGHAWVDGRKTEADLAALTARLGDTGVRDLYVHTGPLENDGTLNRTRYPAATKLIESLHNALPGIRVQAWLGNVVGRHALDLELPDRRANITASAVQALDGGFDGVHFDLEPIADSDGRYLDVLARSRAAVNARGAILSVAAHQIEPADNLVTFARLSSAERTKWWTPAYFTEIASRVDQIAVMAYDTWMPTRGLFGGYVTRQTKLALARTPPGTELLIGLPFFHDDTIGHHENAERAATAARAVRLGLDSSPRPNFGVALYIDFAATEPDWQAYHQIWLSPNQ